jgi:hypothetical protein
LPVERQYVYLLYNRSDWVKEWSQIGNQTQERWLTYPVREENEVLWRHEPDLLFVD